MTPALVVFDAMETSPEVTLALNPQTCALREDRDDLAEMDLFNLCRGKAEIGTIRVVEHDAELGEVR